MKRILASLAAIALLSAGPATAQGWGDSFSPKQARDAVRDGKTVPLSRIFGMLKQGGGAEYHIDWMTEDGRKMRFIVDAQSGAITDRRGG